MQLVLKDIGAKRIFFLFRCGRPFSDQRKDCFLQEIKWRLRLDIIQPEIQDAEVRKPENIMAIFLIRAV